MAERPAAVLVESCQVPVDEQTQASPRGTKRSSCANLIQEPPQKSPCTLQPDACEAPPMGGGMLDCTLGAVQDEGQARQQCDEGPKLSPRTRRKSWRRSGRGRRSLLPLPCRDHALCKTISVTLPEEERLEKLMEESMKLAVQKLKETLCCTDGADLDLFQKHKKSVELKWQCLAKEIKSASQNQSSPKRDPKMEMTIESIRKSISSLQTECASWEALLEKHRAKAQELARRVEQGRATGLNLDLTTLGQSSQSQLVLSKPDYSSILDRQRLALQTMELLMDTQCKIVRELLSFQEECQIAVKKTSSRLASAAGFPDISSSSSLVRQLIQIDPESSH